MTAGVHTHTSRYTDTWTDTNWFYNLCHDNDNDDNAYLGVTVYSVDQAVTDNDLPETCQSSQVPQHQHRYHSFLDWLRLCPLAEVAVLV